MKKVLLVKFTPREGSNTAKIADAFVEAAGGAVTLRDLSAVRVPLICAWEMESFWSEDKPSDSKFENASKEYIAELKQADHIVIATPMYNFGLPAAVKAWFDAVIRAGETFEYTQDGPKGLLDSPSATIIMTTGGVPEGSGADYLSPHTKTMLGLMGVSDVKTIAACGLSGMSEEEASEAVSAACEIAKADGASCA